MADKTGLEGLKAAAETIKQLISLATLLLGFTLTFASEFKPEDAALKVPGTLVLSWGLLIACVVFGLWALMALTGSTVEAEKAGTVGDAMKVNVQFPSLLCILSFVAAIIAMSWAGWTIVG